MNDIPSIISTTSGQMTKAVEHTLQEFASLHTGKASPSMVDGLQVHVASYGSTMHVRDLAAVTTPDARMIQLQVWDQGTISDIEKAIKTANLGLNPITEGAVMRIPIPELSKQRRQELVKVTNNMAENGRVAIRAARHDALDALRKLKADGGVSEDDISRAEKDIQKLTDKHVELVNNQLAAKEKELLTV